MAFSLKLQSSLEVLPGLRNRLRGWLADVGVGQDDQEAIVLACWEAAANAVEHPLHAGGDIRVDAERHLDHIVVCVADTGTWPARAAPRGERGLGLRLIGSLMDRVRVVRTRDGTRVVMCRRLSPPGTSAD
jgi:serine/threonine-protein kinase RsbW